VASHLGQARGVSAQRWNEPDDSLRTVRSLERMAAILRFICWSGYHRGMWVLIVFGCGSDVVTYQSFP